MKLLSKKDVCALTSLSRAHVDRLSHDPEYAHMDFPKPCRIGQGRVAYVEAEVLEWIANQIAKRGS